MKNIGKTKLLSLLLVLVTLFTAVSIPISALETDISSDSSYEEIMPLMANGCHGTSEHQQAIDSFIASYPEATDTYQNKQLSTAGLVGTWRPDAIVICPGNIIHIHEVVSPSQTVDEIVNKIYEMKNLNPGKNIIWSYQTIGGSMIMC